MATHKIGKLKINTSENGLAFRFGDGNIHRIGRKNSDSSEYDEMYEDEDLREDEDYEDLGYDDDRDDGYGDDYTDGDYEDDYEDGEQYDDDGYYDDRYRDEDAEDYPEDEEEYLSENPVLRFLEENDWATYVLLFLLPPVGVWLLWHRRKFDKPIRYGVSAVSLLWFIILLVIIFSSLLSGNGDTTVSGNITMTTPVPTVSVQATETPEATATAATGALIDPEDTSEGDQAGTTDLASDLAPDTTPTATALAGANGAVAANSVYMTATGLYYHNNVACETLNDGTAVSTVTTNVAIERGKTPCPVCYPDQKVFYATDNGKYYHSDQTCSGMTDATTITEEAAKAAGKTACPVCITGDLKSLGTLKFIDENTKDRSGILVYATKEGKYFHTEANCSGMTNAATGSLLKAILAGKSPCPTCAKTAGTNVWCTKEGTYYHNKSDCSGMEGAYKITLAEAMIMGKKRCGTCWGKDKGIFTSNATASGDAQAATTTGGTVYVYATQGGTYFHTNATCSGMTGATRITLSQAIKAGKKSCPTCASGADTVAYVTTGGTYYHSQSGCSGMRNAKQTTVAQALADGYKKCATCWGGTGEGTGASTLVYATQGGTYYHTNATCSGMTGASAITLEQAVKGGKKACPTCASAASRKVYSTQGGKYYHSKSSCDGMTGATQRTLEEAVLMGQTACPKCIGTLGNSKITGKGTFSKKKASTSLSNVTKAALSKAKSSGMKITVSSSGKISVGSVSKGSFTLKGAVTSGSISGTGSLSSAVASSIKTGTSGIKVYATASGKYYHTYKSHAGSGAAHVSLETAIKYGKKACPSCASTAERTVYATMGGKYYHYYKAHAGSGAYGGKLSYALALGLDACPTCVKYAKAKATGTLGNYTSGKSGIKVYATITGKYYHVSQMCAGSSAAHISLETAMNYGKTACPTCTALAKKTVYAVAGGKYYHSSKTHAGLGAVSGTLASAMAAGLKACPACITGSEAYEEADIKYSAAGDTSVYVDLDNDLAYYHRTANCSDAGMSGGTRVQLEFVIKWGYKACPYCNPPTSVSD